MEFHTLPRHFDSKTKQNKGGHFHLHDILFNTRTHPPPLPDHPSSPTAMDFLKWDSEKETLEPTDSGKRQSNTFGFVQDNISSFFNPNTSSDSLPSTATTDYNSAAPASSAPHRKGSDTASIASNDKPSSSSSAFASFKSKQQSQLTDILIEKLLAMAIPPATEIGANSIQGRVQAGKTRPMLSVPTMSKNFIQLNSRLAVPFELIDNVIRFFSWENPTLTLTVLTLYTHIVLKPLPMLSSFPFFFVIVYIMAPAYTTMHQPEQHTVLGKQNPVLAEGPRLKKVDTPKPAPEFSQEFILNLTDLQNHMVLYVMVWDFVVATMNKFAYFVDSCLSPFYFLTFFLTGISFLLFGDVIFQYLPWKLILIASGWGLTAAFHPYLYDYVFKFVYSEETRYYILGKTNRFEEMIHANFEYEEPQEQKEVEMFEIQQFNKSTKEWNLCFFLDNDFTKISSARLSYDETKPIGTLAKSSMKPPKDWEFVPSDDWRIDLSPELWIKSHLLDGVVRTDDETKWVYDLGESTHGYQPQFRRRRWTRSVMRHSEVVMKPSPSKNKLMDDV